MPGKVQKYKPQDFFPRSGNAKTQGFIFNQAPLNKNKAKEESKVAYKENKNKRSAFMAKLYQDDEDQDDMKVFNMGSDDEDKPDDDVTNKRKTKEHEKKVSITKPKTSTISASKIGKLKFSKGSLGLFAIHEIHPTYIIVNYTRNVKGYLPMEGKEEMAKKLEVGQLIIAAILAEGTTTHNAETSGNSNRKLQLSLDHELINKGLTAESVQPNMCLQGEVEAKEAKGFLINFGMKDKSKGFLPFSDEAAHVQVGNLIQVQVKKVIASSKVIRCEVLNDENLKKNLASSEELTLHTMKPGFYVTAKITKLLDNGLEVNFLGGFTGTIFVDHIDRESISKYRTGEKINPRIIAVDSQTKTISLTLLSHIVNMGNAKQELLQQGVSVGKLYEKAKVSKVVFGNSYEVTLGKGISGFLHKIHTARKEKTELGEETMNLQELDVGKVIDKVRVKEINYFDGKPILSMREDIINSSALNYKTIEVGMYVSGKIEEVNETEKYVSLRLNEFVKGKLYIEHMADYPLKVLPPKFKEIGKSIKLRVFNVDPEDRTLEFTKKETFLKAKTPVYQSYREVQKGSKIVGLVVDDNEHGYVIKSFGGVKGLLTFKEIQQNGKSSKKEYKFGNIVKGYVLFKKKDQGMAITLDKQKAKELRKENQSKSSKKPDQLEDQQIFESDFLPTQEQCEKLKERFKSLSKSSSNVSNIGKVLTFRVIEQDKKYVIVKSLDAPKKSANIFAVLPKCLISNFSISMALEQQDFSFQGLVVEVYNDVPVITAMQELIESKDEVPSSNEDIVAESKRTFVGFVSEANRRGVTVRFFAGLKKLVLVKDLETTTNFTSVYKVGGVVRVTKNKLDRLCLKHKVVYYDNAQLQQKDKETQIKSFFSQMQTSIEKYPLKIGQKVDAQVQLIKDYGLIVSINQAPNLPGFIIDAHKLNQNAKSYKEGSKLQCIVMGFEFDQNLVDLSERLASLPASGTNIKKGQQQKVTVELNKEEYLIVSFKQNKQVLGICMMQSFNKDEAEKPNAKYQIGEELEVNTLEVSDKGLVLTTPIVTVVDKVAKPRVQTDSNVDLVPGVMVTGQIKSIKGQCLFLQLPSTSQLVIGRLHRLECQSEQEFKSFSIGDRVQAKVLQVTKDKKKTWIEFTRRKEHMKIPSGLNQDVLKQMVMSYDSLKNGKEYQALVTEVNFEFSSPILIHLSPFVKGQISFNGIASPLDLLTNGESALQKYKAGDMVTVYHKNGKFSLTQDAVSKKKYEKEELVVARFVKAIKGRGVTVQLDEGVFGFIELVEITDDVTGNVFDHIAHRHIFPARVIDANKDGKLMLSARESVVDPKSWGIVGPEGKSIHFQKLDEKRQKSGNQRNKILKYGADVALQLGDLCVGYVTNISKSGCFVQIGHNCTVRAGLNELSDQSSFNYLEEMPVGRVVLGRITKVEDQGDKKRFHFTLRRSLVVYGVGAVDRSALQEGNQVETIVMTVLDDKVFAQIKGSYLKIKVKNVTDQIREGDHLIVKLKKVTKQKITGEYEGKVQGVGLTDEEKVFDKMYQSVQQEAQKDIDQMKIEANQNEIDEEALKGRVNKDIDEVEMQMEDLKELDKDDDMETVQEDDSDVEEMQRIIKESKFYSGEENSDEEMQDESQEQEDAEDDQDGDDNEEQSENASDEEMEDDSEEEVVKKSGKQSLKARVNEERQIRKKEQQMRDNDTQPQSIDDYERLLVANQDQSYVWIQYIAFMLDKLGVESARRVAERAVQSVSISNEEDKFNIWIAYMNLENNFGTQETLQKVVKRALEVNDRKKIYLQLVSIYLSSHKYESIEDIYKLLCKKYNTSLKIWSGYLEFLFQMRELKKDTKAVHKFLINDIEFTDPKVILQRSLQALPKQKHVNIITKFGMLEFKNGAPENGRTMFEGIVNNYPKRMDTWAIYMDMEVKYGGQNTQQARHLFERCLNNDFIQKKPKKMKLVFQKYMEFEMAHGNKKNVEKIRQRVEEYLDKAYVADGKKEESEDSDQMVNLRNIVLALSFVGAVFALQNYKSCYSCFYQNRNDYMYCNSNALCLPLKSTQCAAKDIIYSPFQCSEGFADCTNVTFTDLSRGNEISYGQSLQSGFGCFIQIDRWSNGSYGTVQIQYDSSDIKVFDNNVTNYTSGDLLGLPLTDYGWGARKIFVANIGENPQGFTAVFNGSGYKAFSLLILSALVSLLLI